MMNYFDAAENIRNAINKNETFVAEQKEILVWGIEKCTQKILEQVNNGGTVDDQKSASAFEVSMAFTNMYLYQQGYENYKNLIREDTQTCVEYARDLYKFLIKKEV